MRRYAAALELVRRARRKLPPGSAYLKAMDDALDAVDLDIAREREREYGPDWRELFGDEISRKEPS